MFYDQYIRQGEIHYSFFFFLKTGRTQSSSHSHTLVCKHVFGLFRKVSRTHLLIQKTCNNQTYCHTTETRLIDRSSQQDSCSLLSIPLCVADVCDTVKYKQARLLQGVWSNIACTTECNVIPSYGLSSGIKQYLLDITVLCIAHSELRESTLLLAMGQLCF